MRTVHESENALAVLDMPLCSVCPTTTTICALQLLKHLYWVLPLVMYFTCYRWQIPTETASVLRVSTIDLMYVCVIITFLQGLSDSRLEKSQSLLHCFKGTKGKGFMPLALHCGAASDRKIQTSAFPVSSFIMKPLIKLTRKKKIYRYVAQ